MPTPATWDPKSQRYRVAGRFVARAQVRRDLDAVLAKADRRTRALGEALRGGQLALDDWQAAMRAEIKRTQLMSAANAKGGWAQMTPADYGRVGQRVRVQYTYLQRFAEQIADGLPLNGTFLTRSELYAEAARSTYHAVERAEMATRGFTLERNILGDARHCSGDRSCPSQTARGAVPIGTLIPIGSRRCMTRCRCRLAYLTPEGVASAP